MAIDNITVYNKPVGNRTGVKKRRSIVFSENFSNFKKFIIYVTTIKLFEKEITILSVASTLIDQISRNPIENSIPSLTITFHRNSKIRCKFGPCLERNNDPVFPFSRQNWTNNARAGFVTGIIKTLRNPNASVERWKAADNRIKDSYDSSSAIPYKAPN